MCMEAVTYIATYFAYDLVSVTWKDILCKNTKHLKNQKMYGFQDTSSFGKHGSYLGIFGVSKHYIFVHNLGSKLLFTNLVHNFRS